ncbi:non-structural maintenance of chromosomes element 4 homolog A-like [Zophobas morio]|uniref:non-structural maintenance of chromosomes element 4 homolog A-like n=1 Tax=Zophobas morio TaxID=2755281 RepID=UPI0030833512
MSSEQLSQESRLSLRRDYRSLLKETEESRNELEVPTSTGLTEGLNKCNELFSRVETCREAVLDSEYLVVSSSIALKKSLNLNLNFVSFDATFYVNKVKEFINRADFLDNSELNRTCRQFEWAFLGKHVEELFSGRPPRIDFISGALSQVVPEGKSRQRRQTGRTTSASEEDARPFTDGNESGQEEATTREVARVAKYSGFVYLRRLRRPMCLFRFIMNPFSFVATVENIFYLSFLVKDGWAAIQLDKDTNLPTIEPATPGIEHETSSERNQLVWSFTMNDWTAAVKAFDIKRPFIPPAADEESSEARDDQESD